MFNFKEFIENLKEKAEKKDIIEKYEKLVEPLSNKFEDTIIYRDYLSKFNMEELNLIYPESIDESFDWDLLLRLIVSSFSSSYLLNVDKNSEKMEMIINVSAWEKHIAKKLQELWWFQISRMYEIYIEEQMNLEILAHEDENEKDIVLTQRTSNLDKWQLTLNKLDYNKEKIKEEEERQEKLDDLMWKL